MTAALQDSATMLRRNLRRTLRYPVAAAATVGVPIVFLLLFVFVFGDTMGAGLAGAAGGRDEYLDYVTPGILLIASAGAAQGAAISVATDMTEGIVARFRTMPIARASVLAGHVAGNLIQTLVAIAIVVGAALPLMLLPFLGSGFVPTDSLPAGIRAFAEHQPFTPIMETLRGLLMGVPIGSSGVLAVAWCAAIALLGYLWAGRLYERDPAP